MYIFFHYNNFDNFYRKKDSVWVSYFTHVLESVVVWFFRVKSFCIYHHHHILLYYLFSWHVCIKILGLLLVWKQERVPNQSDNDFLNLFISLVNKAAQELDLITISTHTVAFLLYTYMKPNSTVPCSKGKAQLNVMEYWLCSDF